MVFAVVDEFTRKCPALKVEQRMTERDVVAILLWLEAKHGASGAIRPDRGPEFIARAVEKWLGARKVRPLYIAPGSLCETWLPNSLYIFEAWLGARLKALVTALRVQGNYTGLDLYNRDQYGTFILAAPNCPCTGECQGAKLLDIEPTLQGLGGCEIPSSMQGRSLVDGMEKKPARRSDENEGIIRLGFQPLATLIFSNALPSESS